MAFNKFDFMLVDKYNFTREPADCFCVVPRLAPEAHYVDKRTFTVRSQWTTGDEHRGCIIRMDKGQVFCWYQPVNVDEDGLHMYSMIPAYRMIYGAWAKRWLSAECLHRLATQVTASNHVDAVTLALQMIVARVNDEHQQLYDMRNDGKRLLGVDVLPEVGKIDNLRVHRLPHAVHADYHRMDHVVFADGKLVKDEREIAYAHQVMADDLDLDNPERWMTIATEHVGDDILAVVHRQSMSSSKLRQMFAVKVHDRFCLVDQDITYNLYSECDEAYDRYKAAVETLTGQATIPLWRSG